LEQGRRGKNLADNVKKYFAQNNITLYIINATTIAQEIGLGNRTNTILQSAFFKITNVIPLIWLLTDEEIHC
jgi:pyruvate-ferredoxin/flavodoxin oxidoreductase